MNTTQQSVELLLFPTTTIPFCSSVWSATEDRVGFLLCINISNERQRYRTNKLGWLSSSSLLNAVTKLVSYVVETQGLFQILNRTFPCGAPAYSKSYGCFYIRRSKECNLKFYALPLEVHIFDVTKHYLIHLIFS